MREMEEDGKYWMEVVELSKAVKSRVELKKEGSKDAAQRSAAQPQAKLGRRGSSVATTCGGAFQLCSSAF